MFFGGFLVPVMGILGMVVFSLSIFFNIGLVMVWLFLELCGLCLIPLFFWGEACFGMIGLFYYVVFSGLSSCLILMGLLLSDCVFFLLAGFLMKFGIFPLWGWVYRVCCFSDWFVVWGFSTILKFSFIVFPLFLVFHTPWWLSAICGFGCFLLSFFFWCFTYDWKICWCHMMLSSSSVLVGVSISGCGLEALLAVFFVYGLWATLVLYYFSYYGEGVGHIGLLSAPIFFLLLLSFPSSLSVFYKILVCSCIFSSGLFLLLCWVVYCLSEQFYLFFFLIGLYTGKPEGGSLSGV